MPKSAKSAKSATARYGIAEWYGKDITIMTVDERKFFGEIAYAQATDKEPSHLPPCPFLGSIAPDAMCNKSGGLCSMRPYTRGEKFRDADFKDKKNRVVELFEGCPKTEISPSTMCPLRFLEDSIVFKWVGQVMLNTDTPLVVKETPFLKKLKSVAEVDNATSVKNDEEAEDKKRAGRIDWILVDPASAATNHLKWCAVETQGVYFSGTKMEREFQVLAEDGTHVLYPVGNRRPDYRSNGPKRLAPQLAVKVPVLRTWGTKVAVVVDRYFFGEMAELKPSFRTARTDQDRLDSAEVVWFVVDYDENMRLMPHKVFYSDLDKSVEALNATEPIERGKFQSDLKALLLDMSRRGSKVFELTKDE